MAAGERRTTTRVPLVRTIKEEYLSEIQEVKGVNISEHGMCYQRPCDSGRRKGGEVLLTFSLLDRLQPIKALGWVVEEKEMGEKIEAHITFMFLPEQDEELIRGFVVSQQEGCAET